MISLPLTTVVVSTMALVTLFSFVSNKGIKGKHS